MEQAEPGAASQLLVGAVRKALAAAADPARAAGQQAYMKSQLPYRGLAAPTLAATLRPLFEDPAHRLQTRAQLFGAVLALWDGAGYREERYAAIALTGQRLYQRWLDPDAVPLYEHLVRTGAWWDYVDPIASRRFGPILRAYPVQLGPVVRGWAVDRDRWIRRTAILSQLGSRGDTDRRLLLDCIEPSLGDEDFFLRKAVGWALRQEAKSAGGPEWVREVVAAYGDRLSPLSRREALKHVEGPGPGQIGVAS